MNVHIYSSLLLLLLALPDSFCLNCLQCNGWHGNYRPGNTEVSTCDNRNNQCYTTLYCVKIIDPVDPNKHYVTYKSDCWFQSTVVTNASITMTVANKVCYTYSDGGNPPKTYLYCFCNDRDYCNSANALSVFSAIFVVIIFRFAL